MNDSSETKVLVIEDNPGDVRLLKDMLEEAQYQRFSLNHAETLSEGCNKLSDGLFDVVLLDIGLPDSSGTDSIDAVRKKSPESPVIMLTGLDDENTALSCIKRGAQDYLIKGRIDSDLLLRSIRYAIERNHASALLESKQRFIQHMADTTPDILYIFDLTTHSLVYVNEALKDTLGYTVDDVNSFGNSIYSKLAHPDDLSLVREYIKKLYATPDDEKADLECRVLHRNGEWRWMQFRSVVFSREQSGMTKEILGTAHDITNRKESEHKIRIALEEKDLLLREIHHRVKNNMTVIFSMLKLQSRYVRDEQYRKMFHDSMSRIKSMALVHEKLYRSDNLAAINFNAYLKDLTFSLFSAYKVPYDQIILKMDVEDITLGIDKAIPCGLIVTELVSNSMKHAFPDSRKGEIGVSLHEIDEQGHVDGGMRDSGPIKAESRNSSGIELVVSDNGAGMPGEIDQVDPKSLGLNLVKALVKQLNGKMEVVLDNGTEFRVRFKK